ncbi:lactation elevated protein 1-like protein, partial [Lates japonicus]
VRVVILADHPLEDIFVHDGDHGHDESHILMDDLGLKRDRGDAALVVKERRLIPPTLWTRLFS